MLKKGMNLIELELINQTNQYLSIINSFQSAWIIFNLAQTNKSLHFKIFEMLFVCI